MHLWKQQTYIYSWRANKLQLKVRVCYSQPCLTFTVGIIISQWAEAILTDAAVSCLQVHTVGVLHAAVALWAEVMTCRRHREKKVETQRRGKEKEWRMHTGPVERLCHSITTFSLSLHTVDPPQGTLDKCFSLICHNFSLLHLISKYERTKINYNHLQMVDICLF